MSIRLKPRVRLTEKQEVITAIVSIVVLAGFFFFFGYFNTALPKKAHASANETVNAGSYIINMGITPQTIANGLKPYGLVHKMVVDYQVPVKWVIDQSKSQNGIDFTHDGVSYRGGTFIIPVEFITPAVAAEITAWNALGVVGAYAVSDITVPVYMTITSYPRIVVDTLSGNQAIIGNYFTNAGIDSTYYEHGAPSTVTTCHDVWVNPHGDPTWISHYYLKDFVTTQKSYIWSQCHAVSMLENCVNPADPYDQLNYLSTNGLQCWGLAKCGSVTEVHAKALPALNSMTGFGDPVMQFMGNIQNASSGGSERWYIPLTTGQWRKNTINYITVDTFSAPREGVVLTYGPAYGDYNNGMVMYQGGHDLNGFGSVEHKVGAQRAFLNFMFLAAKAKAPLLVSAINSNMEADSSYNLEATVSGGVAPYTYQWTSSNGGSFTNPTGDTTNFTPPLVFAPTTTIITCLITDNCGRTNFHTQVVTIAPAPLPVTLLTFKATPIDNFVEIEWVTGSELNNQYFAVERSGDGRHFESIRIVNSMGNSNTPQSYMYADYSPLPATSYYRLSQTDYDGTTSYSNTVSVNFKGIKGADPIAIGPNPFTDKIKFNYQVEEGCTVEATLVNAKGEVIRKVEFDVTAGNNHLVLGQLDELHSGTYLLTINDGQGNHYTRKLIKN